MSRPSLDDKNARLRAVLEEMLEADEDITARATVLRHKGLKHASALSRIADRKALLVEYQEKQRTRRNWAIRTQKEPRARLSKKLADQETLIARLEELVADLADAHMRLTLVVGEMGGRRKLGEYYKHHTEVLARLESVGALPADLLDAKV